MPRMYMKTIMKAVCNCTRPDLPNIAPSAVCLAAGRNRNLQCNLQRPSSARFPTGSPRTAMYWSLVGCSGAGTKFRRPPCKAHHLLLGPRLTFLPRPGESGASPRLASATSARTFSYSACQHGHPVSLCCASHALVWGRQVCASFVYDAFGVAGTDVQEKIGVFHTSSLKTAPKTPNAS